MLYATLCEHCDEFIMASNIRTLTRYFWFWRVSDITGKRTVGGYVFYLSHFFLDGLISHIIMTHYVLSHYGPLSFFSHLFNGEHGSNKEHSFSISPLLYNILLKGSCSLVYSEMINHDINSNDFILILTLNASWKKCLCKTPGFLNGLCEMKRKKKKKKKPYTPVSQDCSRQNNTPYLKECVACQILKKTSSSLSGRKMFFWQLPWLISTQRGSNVFTVKTWTCRS